MTKETMNESKPDLNRELPDWISYASNKAKIVLDKNRITDQFDKNDTVTSAEMEPLSPDIVCYYSSRPSSKDVTPCVAGKPDNRRQHSTAVYKLFDGIEPNVMNTIIKDVQTLEDRFHQRTGKDQKIKSLEEYIKICVPDTIYGQTRRIETLTYARDLSIRFPILGVLFYTYDQVLVFKNHRDLWSPVGDFRRLKYNDEMEIPTETVERIFNDKLWVKNTTNEQIYDHYQLDGKHHLDQCKYLECEIFNAISPISYKLGVFMIPIDGHALAFKLKEPTNGNVIKFMEVDLLLRIVPKQEPDEFFLLRPFARWIVETYKPFVPRF